LIRYLFKAIILTRPGNIFKNTCLSLLVTRPYYLYQWKNGGLAYGERTNGFYFYRVARATYSSLRTLCKEVEYHPPSCPSHEEEVGLSRKEEIKDSKTHDSRNNLVPSVKRQRKLII
jgi:hypothetical protein